MTDLLNHIYAQKGFRPITLNIPEIYLNVKKHTSETLAIVTVDETKSAVYTREQFENISRQIRFFLTDNDCLRYRFLYILISDDDNCINRLLNDDVSCWRIIPNLNRLMIFETSCDGFMELRKPIEDMLDSHQTEKPEETSCQPKYDEPSQKNAYSSLLDKEVNIKLAPVNIGIAALNVIIFIIISILSAPGSDGIIDKFALAWDLFFKNSEYYRIVTSMFIHSGLDHLYNNIIVLLVIGSYFELAAGHLNYIIVYFSSGIIAGFTSMLYNMSENDYVQSVGASGAIFGLTGGMIAVILINYIHKQSLDLVKIAFVAFLSLYGGFANQGVDNAAHIGGMISGFLISFVLYPIYTKHHKADLYKQNE